MLIMLKKTKREVVNWTTELTVIPDLISSGVIETLNVYNNRLYVTARDGIVSTSYQDFIRTYDIEVDGSLTQVATLGLTSLSPYYAEYDQYVGTLINGIKLYACYRGGWISCDLETDGSLTVTKNTGWRPGGGRDIFPGDVLHNKYVECCHGTANSLEARWGYWICDGINDHSGPYLTSYYSTSRRPVRYAVDNFYAISRYGDYVYHFKLDSGGTQSYQASYATGASAQYVLQVYGNNLYFQDTYDIHYTYDGYFPINANGTLGTRVDTPGTFNTRYKVDLNNYRPVAVGGFIYRISDDELKVERGL